MVDLSFISSQSTVSFLFLISFTLLIVIIIDNVLRSFIRVPRALDNRQTRVYLGVLHKIVTIIVYAVALYFVFRTLGIDIAPLLASAGLVGIVIGIGARALIEDLINGFFLVTQDSIAVGDNVKIDDVEGIVEKLGFRSLTILGAGGELYMIPNGLVKRVVNYSRNKANMLVDFPIRADQDIDSAFKSLEEAIVGLRHDKDYGGQVLEGSEVLGIADFKIEGRVILRAKIRTAPEVRYKVLRKYRYLVKKNFEKNKVALI